MTDEPGSLRTELDRIAHDGAAFEPDPRVWARGRRARARDRMATVVAVAAALVCLVMIGLIARPQADPVPAGTPESPLGVPKTIWPVPTRLVQYKEEATTWDRRVVETDLAIGRGAVAISAGGRGDLVAVITAADGRYHPLELPGYVRTRLINSASEEVPLALSPDGSRLAYGWWDPAAPLDRPMPAGVRIVDLSTGTIRTIALEGGNGMRVRSLSWSPDSRWIGWLAERTKSWTPMSSSSSGGTVAGRISPAGKVTYLQARFNMATRAAISSTGVVAVRDGNAITTWDGNSSERHRWSDGSEAAAAAAWSPEGSRLALTSPRAATSFAFTGRDWNRLQAALPRGFDEAATIDPLGWIDDRTVVTLVQPNRIDGPVPDARLALVRLDAENNAAYQFIGRIAGYAPTGFSVAVDLLKADRTTVVRPKPEWPWSSERKWAVGLLGGAALLIALGLVRRKMTTGPTPKG